MANKFRQKAPNICTCTSSIWNFLNVTLLVPRILRSLLDFWKSLWAPDISRFHSRLVLHMHRQFSITRGHGSQIRFYIGPNNISKCTAIQDICHYGLPQRGLCYVDLRSTCFTPLRFNAPCQHHFSIYAHLF
jgi:hypothetical protein